MKQILRRGLQQITRAGMIRQVGVIAGGTAFGQLVVLASSPLLTRLYSPAELGIYAVYISILSPILAMSSLRFDVALILPESEREAGALATAAVASIAAFATISLIVALTWGDQVADVLNAHALAPYLLFIPLSIVFGGLFQLFSYVSVRGKNYQALGIAKASQGVATVVTQLAVGVAATSSVGLFLGDAIGRGAGVIRLGRDTNKRLPLRQRLPLNRQDMWATIVRYKRFPLFSLAPTLLNSIALQLPAILLSALFGSTPTGLYMIGQRVLGMPLNLVSSAVAQVFLGNSTTTARTSVDMLHRKVVRTLRALFAIGVIAVVPVVLVAPFAFRVLFGAEWEAAGRYLQLLAPLFILQFCASPLGGVLDLLERQDLHLVREVVRILAVIVGVFVARHWYGSVSSVVFGISIGSSVGYIFGIGTVFAALSTAAATETEQRGGGAE